MAGDLNRSIKIFIDNENANKKADDLRARVNKLGAELEKLAATEGKNSDAYKKKEKIYNAAVKSLNTYNTKIKETERVLKNLSKATYDELIKAKNDLTRSLKDTERGTESYHQKLLLLKQTNTELAKVQKEMRTEGGRQAGMWCKVADGFNKYIGLIGGAIATVTGLSMTFRRLAEDVAKMDDIYATVMKTTGMTREEVVELNEAFKKMDTRTSREQLNALAETAGRLGISAKEDVMQFVEAADIIQVALGDVLGENAIRDIGKMSDVFSKVQDDLKNLSLKEQMLAVANSVNELGKTSTANEQYLVDFAGRLGGVATQAGISIQNILGFGSALDQNMQKVEMSATTIQKFIMKVMGEPAKFAKIVGLEVEGFTKLLQEDANEAIKQVIRALGDKGGFQQLIPIFQDIGMDGARAVGVLSALATNIDKVDEAQAIANRAFIEGTSAVEEYNIKNNNLQAQLEKARKKFKDTALELGEKLSPALLKSVKGSTLLIKALAGFPKWLSENKGMLLTLVAVLSAYTVAVNYSRIAKLLDIEIYKKKIAAIKASIAVTTLETTAIKNASISTRIYIAATQGLAAAKLLLTGKINGAKTAFKAMSAAMGVNPYVIVGMAIAALTIGIYKFATRTTVAEKAMKEFNREALKQQTELNNIFEAYKKANEGTDEKKRLLELIKKKYGPYIQDLIDEEGKITDIAKAQEQANKALKESIALKTRDAAIADATSESINTQADIINNLRKQIEKRKGENLGNIIVDDIVNTLTGAKTKDKLDEAYKEAAQILLDNDIIYTGGFREPLNFVNQLYGELTKLNNTVDETTKKFKFLVPSKTEPTNEDEDDSAPDATVLSGGDPDPDPDKQSKVKAALDLRLKQLEEYYKQRLLLIEENREREDMEENEYQRSLLIAEDDYLAQRINVLENFHTGYEKLQLEANEKLLDDKKKVLQNTRKYDELVLSYMLDEHKKKLAIIDKTAEDERFKLKLQLEKKQITQEQYDARMLALEHSTAYLRQQAITGYEQALIKVQIANESIKKNVVKKAGEERVAAERDTLLKLAALTKNYTESEKSLLQQYGKIGIEQQKKEELDRIEAMYKEGTIRKEVYEIAKAAIEKKYEDEKLKVRQEYGIARMDELHQLEFDALKEKLDKELLTVEQYEQAKKQLKLKHAKEYTDQAQTFIQAGADFVKAIEEAETAKVSAEYTKRTSALTEQYNQGLISQEEYNEQKGQLDYEQKVAELDIQKKYADANFAVQTAQIIATTAQGVISAWASSMQLGPIAGPIAAGILILMIAFMAFNVLPPVICVLIAALLTILTGCFRSPEEAFQTIRWESIILIGAMMPMSLAFEKTGLSELISHNLVSWLKDFGPIALLAGIYITTSVLTMFISNTAVAVLVAPIALQTALTMEVSPYPLLMAVTIGASMCFASPFSTPPNALVMSAGKYTFKDYIKVGLPLQIIMGIIMILALPLLFSFT